MGGLHVCPFCLGGAWCVVRSVADTCSEQQGQSHFGTSVSAGVTHNSEGRLN